MQLAISVDLAAIVPCLLQQHSLALILQRTLTKWFTQPCIEAAGMNQLDLSRFGAAPLIT
jgi:hypothetical protein